MTKKLIITLFVIVCITVTLFSVPKKWFYKLNNPTKPFAETPVKDKNLVFAIVKKRAMQLRPYLQKNKYNDSLCFIINMAIPSGKPRLFVYNYIKDTVTHSGLVTHGSGSETTNGNFVFKNIVNSLASSKGKYKIGGSYNGKFGLAYKLHGLDSTNSKAFERFVVLHSHECVPNIAVYPQKICVSSGCPTVAPDFLQKLQVIINKSKNPILLDIQYSKN